MKSPRDRWRCYHRRFGKPILQIRFDNQYDAVWKKIELCADERSNRNSRKPQ